MPLDNEQTTELRRLLERKRESLIGDAESRAHKGAAAATKKAKRPKKPAKKKDPIEQAASHELGEVEHALKRLSAHQERFGFCERCFMEIPWGELAANPARRFCGRCS